MTQDSQPDRPESVPPRRGMLILITVASAVLSFVIAALLINIFQRKQEAKNPYVRLVEVTEDTTDPAEWGKNWPRQYQRYLLTAEASPTNFGGGDAHPAQKAERYPWLTRMFAGYAFALDYRDRRGHAYMLFDQEHTRRVTERPQPGACLHCHASVMPTYRRVGDGDVMAGFVKLSAMTYQQAHDELEKDGAHPVSCVDCHDPDTMHLRVTRPGFMIGIAELAKSDKPIAHLPSIERWRQGSRSEPYDPNKLASRQEMRSFVCGQCHVEYYCGPKETLFFPWGNGLNVDEIEAAYDQHKFPDGQPFYDWAHAETGAHLYKAQHPEFETWSQGIHARSGVACADCHMPYMREGAMKISDHWVRSPLKNVSRACQVCHRYPEQELVSRVDTIQQRTHSQMQLAADAMVDMLDAIKVAKAAGVTEQQLAPALDLHRKAQWRLDFVAAENSMGFHAPQEVTRMLGVAIDQFRQAQLIAERLTPARPTTQPAPAP